MYIHLQTDLSVEKKWPWCSREQSGRQSALHAFSFIKCVKNHLVLCLILWGYQTLLRQLSYKIPLIFCEEGRDLRIIFHHTCF